MKTIKLPGFPYSIELACHSEYLKWCKKWNLTPNGNVGECFHCLNGVRYTIISIDEKFYRQSDIYTKVSACVHEANHAVRQFYIAIGELNPGSEHQAYMNGYITECVMRYMDSIIAKEDKKNAKQQ